MRFVLFPNFCSEILREALFLESGTDKIKALKYFYTDTVHSIVKITSLIANESKFVNIEPLKIISYIWY